MKGISQDRLSKLADLSLNTIVKIESGNNRNPTINTLIKIAKGLKVKVDALISLSMLVLFSACFSAQLFAQELGVKPNEAKKRLVTISEGIKMVLADSRLIKIALFDNQIAYEDSLIGRSALLPHIGLNAAKSYLQYQPASKFGTQAVNTAQKDSYSYGFDVYQTLFDFGKSIFNYMAANELVNAQRAHTDSVKRIATLEFIVAYFDLLQAEKMIIVYEDEVKSLAAYLNDIELLYEQGVVVKNDVLPAKVRLADVKQKLIAARNTKEVAGARLNNILALPLREKIVICDMEMQPIKFPEMEDAWNTARTARPEVLFFMENIQAAKLAVKSKAAGNLPVIFADGSYSYAQNEYQVHEDNFQALIGARMDFYDGGLARAQLLKERALVNKLVAQKDKLLEDIKLEIEDSFFALKNASEKVSVAKDALAQAQENVRFYRSKYNAGSATPTEVLEAIAQQAGAETNYCNSDYELKRGYAQLMYSMGIDLSLIYEKMESK